MESGHRTEGDFSSAWVGRQAHDSSVENISRNDPQNCRFLGFARNDKGEDGALLEFGGPTNYQMLRMKGKGALSF